MFPFSKSVI